MTLTEARAQLDAHRTTCAKALFRCAACVRADDVLAAAERTLLVIDDPMKLRDPGYVDRLDWWWNKMPRGPRPCR